MPKRPPTPQQLGRHAARILERGDDNTGICHACNAERDSTEPDARNYPCDDCGQHMVYGADETLIMFAEYAE